jgi:hypothetical protein
MQFMDSGDLCVQAIIQVKRRKLHFTSAEDYPYPTVYLDEDYKVKRVISKCLGWAVVNASMTHLAFIKSSSFHLWTTEIRYDKHARRECTTRACPKELAGFFPIAEGGPQ